MGRVSTKENKTQYQIFREELGLSREKASELLGWISAERIEKIESEKSLPHPDEVLEMLASLNSIQKRKERLIEITAEGEISGDEIADFVHIQEELERISITVETLQLWSERMLATGAIDIEAYKAHKEKK